MCVEEHQGNVEGAVGNGCVRAKSLVIEMKGSEWVNVIAHR